jgi:hypothetical protein
MTRFSYTIAAAATLALLAAPRAAAQNGDFPEVRAGQPVQRSLDASSPRTVEDKPFQVFQFRAQPDRRYTVTLESPTFDAYVVLGRENGGITEYLREDDDGGEGTSARLRFTVPAAGSYLLIARSYSGDPGAFTLRLEDGGPIVIPTPQPARMGQTVQGTLTDDDGFLPEGEKNYDLYVVRGEPGEDLHVILASEAFDSYLESGEVVDGRFVRDGSNDDYQGRDAGLQLRLGRRGEAVIRATSLNGNQEGAYTLSVRAGRLPEPVEVEGETVEVEEIAAPDYQD